MENSIHFLTKPPERSGRISVTRERMLPLGTETLHVCYLGNQTIMRSHALDHEFFLSFVAVDRSSLSPSALQYQAYYEGV